MTLRSKTLLIVVVALCLLILILNIVFTQLLMDNYQQLEETILKKDIARAQKAFLEQIDQLSIKGSDWAKWDDTYNFLKDKNQDYMDSNLATGSLASLGVNNILYYDIQKKIFHGTGLDYEANSLIPPQKSLLEFIDKEQ